MSDATSHCGDGSAVVRPVVAHLIGSLSCGGDAKNLIALAEVQSEWANVYVVLLDREPGVRAGELAGIATLVVCEDSVGLGEWARQVAPGFLVFHRSGAPSARESAALAVLRAAGVPVFEYNVFGRHDPTTDGAWDGHLHVSRASLRSYVARSKGLGFRSEEHAAVGNAVRLMSPVSREERESARRKLGIEQGSFVVLRLQRADLRKWDPLPVLAVREARRHGVPCTLVCKAVPDELTWWTSLRLGESVRMLPETPSEADTREAIASCDCLVGVSGIGESFGIAIAEAMLAGVPVVVNSTPDMDNAQVELCEHGVTGLVANTSGDLARAFELLWRYPELGASLTDRARERIVAAFSPQSVEARIRRFVAAKMRSTGRNASWIPEASAQNDAYSPDRSFAASFAVRESTALAGSPGAWSDSVEATGMRLLAGALHARRLGLGTSVAAVWARAKAGGVLRR